MNNKIYRTSYDNSTKEFEVLAAEYVFDKYTRQLINIPKWRHHKYYTTLKAALDGARDFRRGIYCYRNFPWDEKRFPHLRPTITVTRYKAARRDDK